MGNENKNASAAVMAKSPTQTPVQARDVQPAAATESTRHADYRTKSSLDLTRRRFPHARKY